jgi:hemoglobin
VTKRHLELPANLPEMIGNVYEAAGGEATFRLLVERFYAGVAADPVLRPLYPEDDLAGATERLTLFLIQYWGGPDTYSRERGHPRLRMRHQPFVIGRRERDAWLARMTEAVESLGLPRAVGDALLGYFEAASTAMINSA